MEQGLTGGCLGVINLCRYQQNMGSMLAPPLSAEHSLGPLVPHRVTVEGSSWRESSTDIAIAGVGWLGIGVSGSASFDVWTHDGEHHEFCKYVDGITRKYIEIYTTNSCNPSAVPSCQGLHAPSPAHSLGDPTLAFQSADQVPCSRHPMAARLLTHSDS